MQGQRGPGCGREAARTSIVRSSRAKGGLRVRGGGQAPAPGAWQRAAGLVLPGVRAALLLESWHWLIRIKYRLPGN